MGTEMKAPENCENIIRNRKQKSAQVENSEKSAKVQTKITEQVENKEEDINVGKKVETKDRKGRKLQCTEDILQSAIAAALVLQLFFG